MKKAHFHPRYVQHRTEYVSPPTPLEICLAPHTETVRRC